MDLPVYLRVLWLYKWLLAVGLILAIVAGFAAGFSLKDGALESRSEKSYSAAATVLVSSKSNPLFQAEIPGQQLTEGVTAPTPVDLSQATVVYAYLVSGSEIRTAVEEQLGELSDVEKVTALRRTTQPTGDEQFPGRLTLPVLNIIGTAATPSRAEEISVAANKAFQEYVTAQQEAQAVEASNRIQLTTLTENAAIEGENSNPLIPVVITALGVFLIFVALAFVLYNAKLSQEKSGAAGRKRGSKASAVAPATGAVGVATSQSALSANIADEDAPDVSRRELADSPSGS
jgi:hypothetical protein